MQINSEKSAFGCIATDKPKLQPDITLAIFIENMQRIQGFYKKNGNALVIIPLYEHWRHILGSREETAAMSVYFHNACMFSSVI